MSWKTKRSMSQQLEWTTSMNLKSFVENYKDRLPTIIRVEAGYEGVDPSLAYSLGEMLWIFEIATQTRVVAKDRHNSYISIPLESSFRFQKLRNNKSDPVSSGVAMPLSDIVKTGHGAFMFEGNQSVSYMKGSDEEGTTQLGTLVVADSYCEKALLGHPIVGMELQFEVCVMPVYVPIQVSAVVCLRDATQDWIQTMDRVGREFIKRFELLKNILVFDCKPETTEEYEYLRPRSVLYEFTKHEGTEKDENIDPSTDEHAYTSLTSPTGCDIPDSFGCVDFPPPPSFASKVEIPPPPSFAFNVDFPPPPPLAYKVNIPPPLPPKSRPMKISLSESELHSNNRMPRESLIPRVGSHFNFETKMFRFIKEGSHEQFNSLEVPPVPPSRQRSHHSSLLSETESPSASLNGLDSKSLERSSALQSNQVSSDERYVQRT